MSLPRLAPFSLERMLRPVELVRDRLRRATAALEQARVPYAVIGGNAVAAWVTRVDPSAVRFTQDVDVLIDRADLDAARTALESAGFNYRHAAGVSMFLDGPQARARDAVHVIFASEKVRAEYPFPAPTVHESEAGAEFWLLALEALVRLMLSSNRNEDGMYLRDLIGVGLIDATWLAKLPPELAARLKQILDAPDG